MPQRFLTEHSISDSCKVCWDEWSFYNDVASTVEAVDKLAIDITNNINTDSIDYIIGLSKSGFPLASLMTNRLNKPLLPFSIGEIFGQCGETIIGFPEDMRKKLEGAKIVLLDSHIRSGETLRLYFKIVESIKIQTLAFCIIADCRIRETDTLSCPIFSIFSPGSIHKELDDYKAQSNLQEFWKNEPKHWLIPPSNLEDKPNEDNSTSKRVEVIDHDLAKKSSEILITQKNNVDIFTPLSLYLNSELFLDLVDISTQKAIENKIDTVVACSFLSIPIAISICSKLISRTKDNDVKFIFLGNGGLDYYKEKFSQRKNILFCDDVLATGGLIYKAYKNFVDGTPNKHLNMVLVLFYQGEFKFKDYTSLLPEKVPIYTLIKSSK